MSVLRTVVLAAAFTAAAAPFGFGGKKGGEHAAGSVDLDDIPDRKMGNDVDLAMAGWQQLAQNPDKMQEVMASLKDPEVVAKAYEMLKDPQYMEAAKAKLAELQAKAQENGLLDANGNPMAGIQSAMAAMGAGAGAGAGGARDWELDAIEKHKAGELNTAELGMANLQHAMQDPSMISEVAQMMRDPNNVAKLKQMMQDPTFVAQAQRVADQMKASGQLPDMSAMRAAMGGAAGGGMGGGMGGGDAAAELARLRQENEMLKQRIR